MWGDSRGSVGAVRCVGLWDDAGVGMQVLWKDTGVCGGGDIEGCGGDAACRGVGGMWGWG